MKPLHVKNFEFKNFELYSYFFLILNISQGFKPIDP